jgi:hypothetical protein
MEVIMENPELQEKWLEIITAYRGSGLTAVEWCEVTGCTIGRLKYWITKFNKAKQQPLDDTKWTQVEIVDANPPQNTAISIHVGAARIEVASGFDHALLADVLRVAVASC